MLDGYRPSPETGLALSQKPSDSAVSKTNTSAAILIHDILT